MNIEFGNMESLHVMKPGDRRRVESLLRLKMLPGDAPRCDFIVMLSRVAGVDVHGTIVQLATAGVRSTKEAIAYLQRHHAKA